MLPIIAIVGRPNVGKSTLFNFLTKTRNAIVGDMPGITRDRHYGEGIVDEKSFIVIDTGGIAESDNKDIAVMTESQVKLAIAEAQIILFIVDAKLGIAHADKTIAAQLRTHTDKKIFVVVNKADHDLLAESSEFYALGFKQVYAISAKTGRGIASLFSVVLHDVPKNTDDTEINKKTGLRIAILGKPNVGKSTLVNRLLGEERVLVMDKPGTTRDSIFIPFEHLAKKYTLIDTAGIRRRTSISNEVEIFSVIKAMQAMKLADIVIFVMDAREGVTDQDLRLLGHTLQTGNALILAFNKWDNMDKEAREQCKSEMDRRLPFVSFARRYFISAKHGTGVGKLYNAIDEIESGLEKALSTNQLTELLLQACDTHQPPLAKGRRVKLRYAHVGSRKPMTIVVHGKQVEALPGSYMTFLANFFRDRLGLEGIPLIIKGVSDENPYAEERQQ